MGRPAVHHHVVPLVVVALVVHAVLGGLWSRRARRGGSVGVEVDAATSSRRPHTTGQVASVVVCVLRVLSIERLTGSPLKCRITICHLKNTRRTGGQAAPNVMNAEKERLPEHGLLKGLGERSDWEKTAS